MDHVALDVSGTSDIHDRKRTKSLRRLWNQLSKCQRSCIYTIVIVLTLTVFYLVSTESERTQISIAESANENKKEVLHNIRNDPRDVDTVFHDNDSEGQVLEEPGGLEADSNRNQVLSPPKVVKKFPGPTTARQEAVVKAFKHAWQGYKQFAWGHDHLKPITEGYSDWFGLGLSIVDSIDTIYIMGLTKEYKEAREWIEKHLHFDVNRDVNLFEVTIRVLGGLLSIYHLSQDRMFLTKAVDLADRLLPSFESESGIPYSDVNLFTRKAHAPKWSPDSSTSEVTTIQLEFRDLSRITGNPKYENAVSKVSLHIHNLEKKDGLVPIFINANTGQFRSYATITLGARGDSYYEYLLKQWLQTGKTIDYLRDDYVTSIMGVEKHLTKRTVPNGFLFIGELLVGGKDFKPKMDHLTCYLPGTLALGVHNGLPESHMKLAEELLTTCYQTYAQQPTFLAPEITYFNIQGENSNDMYVKTNDAHNLLRPEYLESLWYVYQLTGNKTYQDWGWQIFQGFENYTKVKNGYTSIGNVKNPLNDLHDLQYRLDHARPFTPPLEGIQQQYGMNTNLLKEIVTFWRTKYNWREREKLFNKYPQYLTNIQGLDIHYIHVKPKPTNLKVLPLLLLHGWPGSVREFYETIPILTTPQKDKNFVFEVIVASLPGYGFSQPAVRPGLGAAQMAGVFKNLMKRLGFEKYYIQGGDFGHIVLHHLAVLYPEVVAGFHSNMCVVFTPLAALKLLVGSFFPSLVTRPEHVDRIYSVSDFASQRALETGYLHIQATKPDTLGVALRDSPVGLAAYILEKFTTGTNVTHQKREDGGLKEYYDYADLLDNVMVYWITGSMPTAMRLYSETFNKKHMGLAISRMPVQVPSACARFKNDFYGADGILKELYPKLLHLSDYHGGHFAAFQMPETFSKDVFMAVEKFENYHAKQT